MPRSSDASSYRPERHARIASALACRIEGRLRAAALAGVEDPVAVLVEPAGPRGRAVAASLGAADVGRGAALESPRAYPRAVAAAALARPFPRVAADLAAGRVPGPVVVLVVGEAASTILIPADPGGAGGPPSSARGRRRRRGRSR